MTCLKSNRPASSTGPMLLSRSQPLPAQTLLDIEHVFAGTLALLGRDPGGLGLGEDPTSAVSRAEAGNIEYASWLPDPGAVEFASWATHMRATVR